MKVLVNKKEVKVDEFKRVVGFKIEGDVMTGLINSARFVWEYKKYELPKVVVDSANSTRAAYYGRKYILARLKAEGIELDVKTKKSNVPYTHFKTLDGVWVNCFTNGYIRGCVDGIKFAWHPGRYKEAAVYRNDGQKTVVDTKAMTKRIVARIRVEGFATYTDLMKSVNSKYKTIAVKPEIIKPSVNKVEHEYSDEMIMLEGGINKPDASAITEQMALTDAISTRTYSMNPLNDIDLNAEDDDDECIIVVEKRSAASSEMNELIDKVKAITSTYEELNIDCTSDVVGIFNQCCELIEDVESESIATRRPKTLLRKLASIQKACVRTAKSLEVELVA